MSDLREEIRAILREEFAALRAETSPPAGPCHETVRIEGGADLTRFAQGLVARAADPAFAARVTQGDLRFELAPAPAQALPTAAAAGPIIAGPAKRSPDVLDKGLITERDIAALNGARSVTIGKGSRLTPLARDEARRRGIRIERSEA